MRRSRPARMRRAAPRVATILPAAALALLSLPILPDSAQAEKIGALDSFFATGDPEGAPAPAPLAVSGGASVMDPQATPAAARPRAELLLEDERDAGGASILSEAARRSLDAAPPATAASLRVEDPLAERAIETQAQGVAPAPMSRPRRLLQRTPAAPAPSAQPEESVIARIFADAEDPLRDALHRRDDPIRAGGLLLASGAAALDPSIKAQVIDDGALPAAGAVEIEADALDRRAMLIGLGLLAAIVTMATVIFSFAPRGGTTLGRR
ncbi:hypothetical protein P2H44_02565 [Albimonas sp. CAU 1670]|uniref:hypothetical protein n=1 Tax=Albimonas sp. CAU 1670 TaxID=3032599 RepID=UPI0023DA1807|nr:hypothetical protein [Albimonas sp. CAU 1670]MDF2231427.1 hypothetical protein [Albimonas sp. CAU 1670]